MKAEFSTDKRTAALEMAVEYFNNEIDFVAVPAINEKHLKDLDHEAADNLLFLRDEGKLNG